MCGVAGLSFLTDFYRARRFDPVTGLPKPNAFTDFSELLVDQTIPLALGSMKDSDGYTPKEAIELILQVLEFNDNEGNDFDDAEWIAAWITGLEKAQKTSALLQSIGHTLGGRERGGMESCVQSAGQISGERSSKGIPLSKGVRLWEMWCWCSSFHPGSRL